MSDATGLDVLAERLRGLADAPVHTHPDALEGVHRALVSELESLAGAGHVGAERRQR